MDYNLRWPGPHLATDAENMAQSLTDTRILRNDSPLQRAIDESDLTWRVLGTLNLFRLFIAVMLLGLFLFV